MGLFMPSVSKTITWCWNYFYMMIPWQTVFSSFGHSLVFPGASWTWPEDHSHSDTLWLPQSLSSLCLSLCLLPCPIHQTLLLPFALSVRHSQGKGSACCSCRKHTKSEAKIWSLVPLTHISVHHKLRETLQQEASSETYSSISYYQTVFIPAWEIDISVHRGNK